MFNIEIKRTKVAKITDERINLVSEILNGIKIIKMNCWETPFKTLIEKIRKKELKYHAAIYSISALNGFIDLDFSNVMVFVSVTVFFQYTNAPLLPAYLVYLMSYSNRMCAALGFFFMHALTELISARVGIKRIQGYLLLDEVLNKVPNKRSNDKAYVRAEKLTSKWSNDDGTFSLKNISFYLTEGELMAINGPIGAGKTSLLLSLIGEVPYQEGKIKLNGSVFYVSQEPWLFTATIRQNILFGKPYDERKFREIVRVCQLNDDMKQFPNTELTLIGEKGINLSGGQRARVSLARALYADPDIYLLDDPLSAVDTSVAKLLFEKCINGYLKNKIRILVTHQVHYLENVNNVLTLNNVRHK
jgi:ATP-binding cassette, subfamily C (CFTR/MRP), member 4